MVSCTSRPAAVERLSPPMREQAKRSGPIEWTKAIAINARREEIPDAASRIGPTGKKLWTFHTIPRKGEFGYETWLGGADVTGNAGVWGPFSVDTELGYVYLNVEDATNDAYGGTRPGNNLFSSSLVCLDIKTGKRIWHYQLVHH